MKRFLTMLAACAIILGFASSAWAAGQIPEFSDIAEQRQSAKNAIMKLAVLGVFEGDEGLGSSFRPDDTLTRAEFAKIVCYLTGNVEVAEGQQNAESEFPDVPTGEWYSDYVNVAAALGYFVGQPDGTFRPDSVITMNEVVTVALRCVGYTDMVGQRGVADSLAWPKNYMGKAYALGVFDNVDPVVGSNHATRKQAALICDAALELYMMGYGNTDSVYALSLWWDHNIWWFDSDYFTPVYHGITEDGLDIISYGNNYLTYTLVEGGNYHIETILCYAFNCHGTTTTFQGTMTMAENYYISGGLSPADLPGQEARIIYNEDNEILFVRVRNGE